MILVKRFFLISVFLMLFSCTSEDIAIKTEDLNSSLDKEYIENFKNIYVNKHLNNVLEMPKEQVKRFKESLDFNDSEVLISWDNALLRKAYPIKEEYNEILISILTKIDDKDIVYPIYIIDGSNQEYIIDTQIFNEFENIIYGDDEEKDDSLNPVDKGTYIFEDQKNRVFSDGCKRSRGSTCLIKVT